MPDSGLPRWARILGRVLRASVYALGVAVGVGDAWHTSPVILAVIPDRWVLVWAWGAMISGAIGLIAVAAWRWRWELVACTALGAVLAARAVAVWASVGVVDERIAPAAGMTIASVACILRGLDLTVFAMRTTAAARASRGRR